MKTCHHAEIAARVVMDAGGAITFADFDDAMEPQIYFAPLHWVAGWGLPVRHRKRNLDKMCAFAACELGLIEQTADGYRVVTPSTADAEGIPK